MFLYNHFSNPEDIISTLQERGISSLCFIDDCGLFIPSALLSCYTYDMNCLFGTPFSCFISECETRQQGYLIANTPHGVTLMYQMMAKFKYEAISFLSSEDIVELSKERVFVFTKQASGEYRDLHSGICIPIEPIAYLTEEQKKAHQLVGESILEGCVLQKETCQHPWVSDESKSIRKWESLAFPSTPTFPLLDLIDKNCFTDDEQMMLQNEMDYFTKQGTLSCLYALYQAKQNHLSFVAHGDLFTSLLAYALGIVDHKPSHFQLSFSFHKRFYFSIVASKKERTQLLYLFKSVVNAKITLSKPAFSLDMAIKKVANILRLPSESLLSHIHDFTCLQTFRKKMRTYFLFHEEEQSLFELSASLLPLRSKKATLQPHRIAFLPTDTFVMQFEDTAYIDELGIHVMGIPFIDCLLPPNKEEQQRFDMNYAKNPTLRLEYLSFYYLMLRTMTVNYS